MKNIKIGIFVLIALYIIIGLIGYIETRIMAGNVFFLLAIYSLINSIQLYRLNNDGYKRMTVLVFLYVFLGVFALTGFTWSL